MRESTIETAVSKYAKQQGWLCYKWSSPGQRGVPDRIYFKAGRVVLIEFKAPNKKPTALQTHTHGKLNNEGFTVHVIDNTENGKQLFSG